MQMIALDNPLAGTTTTGRADAARAVGTGRVLSRLAVLFLVFGAPAALVILLRLMPWIWRKLEAVAHTLPYDAAVMTQFKIASGAPGVDRGAGAGHARIEKRWQTAGGGASDRRGHSRRAAS
jgi:hypothetical protein